MQVRKLVKLAIRRLNTENYFFGIINRVLAFFRFYSTVSLTAHFGQFQIVENYAKIMLK